MIILYIKHYLNSNGVAYFDNIWFPKVCNIMHQQPGFVDIESHKDTIDSSCIHITLKFASTTYLDTWIKTSEHKIVNLLNPYRTKAWEVARTNDELEKPTTLTWKKIEPTMKNSTLLIRGRKWSYHCVGEGIPCLITGFSPLYQHLPDSDLTKRFKFIFGSLYWVKEHPDFDVSKLTMHDLAQDIDEVRKQLGYDKIAILAHSALGLIALEYALTYPQHNLFNIIIGTPPFYNDNYIQERDGFFQKDASPERKEILKQNLTKFTQQKPSLLSKDQIYIAEYMAKTPLYWFDLHHDSSHDWEQINVNESMRTQYFMKILPDYNKKDQYQNITVPIFLTIGRYDYAVPYTTLDFAKNLKNFSYNLFMKSAHYPMPEEQELFNQKLLQWLDKIAL